MASGIFPVGMVPCVIRLLSTTWLCFQSFPLLYAGGKAKQRLVLRVTVLMKLLTPAVMVDNLAEKVDECPLNWGR